MSEEWVGKASVLGFWDFLATAEKALHSKTWLERCVVGLSGVNYRLATKSKLRFRVRHVDFAKEVETDDVEEKPGWIQGGPHSQEEKA